MAEEIKIPCRFWPNTITNANGYYDVVNQTNDLFNPSGVFLADTIVSDVCFMACAPVPADVHGTPAGKIRIGWITTSVDTTSPWQIIPFVKDVIDGETVDPTTWDDTTAVTDTNSGACFRNEKDVTLTTTAITSGKWVYGVIERDAQVANTNDTLAATVVITDITLIANKA